MNTIESVVEQLKAILGAAIDFEKMPTNYLRTRNGWAGYRGNRRITKFFFSEDGARDAVASRDASDLQVTF